MLDIRRIRADLEGCKQLLAGRNGNHTHFFFFFFVFLQKRAVLFQHILFFPNQ